MILCMMVGISAGAITIKVLNTSQKRELVYFLNSFFRILGEGGVDSLLLLRYSILNNVQTILIIWVLGAIVIGAPLIIGVILLRGFVIGFTVGFLLSELGFKGFFFSLLAVLPQNIFILPGLIIISVFSIKFAIVTIKSKVRKIYRFNYISELFNYSTSVLMLSTIIIIGGFIEAYITPVFMKLIVKLIT